MRHRIAARPVLWFVLVAYGFSYLVGLPFQFAVAAWLPDLPAPSGTYVARSMVVLGPGVAAIVVSAALAGRAGTLELLRGLRPRRADAGWYVAVPLLALGVAVVAFALGGTSPATLVDAASRAWPLLVAHLVLQVIVVGVGEELGWRGWLLPALLARRSRIAATTLVAAIWALWHFPMLLAGLRGAATFLALSGALGVLLAALWMRTRGGTAAAALAHGAFNTPFFFLEDVLPFEMVRSAWERSAILYAVAAAIALASAWRWWGERGESGAGSSRSPLPTP